MLSLQRRLELFAWTFSLSSSSFFFFLSTAFYVFRPPPPVDHHSSLSRRFSLLYSRLFIGAKHNVWMFAWKWIVMKRSFEIWKGGDEGGMESGWCCSSCFSAWDGVRTPPRPTAAHAFSRSGAHLLYMYVAFSVSDCRGWVKHGGNFIRRRSSLINYTHTQNDSLPLCRSPSLSCVVLLSIASPGNIPYQWLSNHFTSLFFSSSVFFFLPSIFLPQQSLPPFSFFPCSTLLFLRPLSQRAQSWVWAVWLRVWAIM